MEFEKIKKSLEEKGYRVSCFDTKEEAAEYLDREIDGCTVGAGGSVTLEQLGIYEKLCNHNDFKWQQRVPEGKTHVDMRFAGLTTEVYLTSANAIAETGEIVNIDGTCNRVAAMHYGHRKVYFIVGENKITKDLESAIWRARNVASPLNAKRLKRNTPCAEKADRCYDCKSPERICKALSVFWLCPGNGEYEVLLIKEDLGY